MPAEIVKGLLFWFPTTFLSYILR